MTNSTNPRTTLHPALIRQPPATYGNSREKASWEFEYEEPAKHPQMSAHFTGSTLSRSSTDSSQDHDVHTRGGKGNGGLCCGICAGLACFECLECCC